MTVSDSRHVSHHTDLAWVTFVDIRSEILPRLEQLLLLDLPMSHQKAVEQLLWKSAFYQVIEVFRQELTEFDDEHIRQQLFAIIDNVISSLHLCMPTGHQLSTPLHCHLHWDLPSVL